MSKQFVTRRMNPGEMRHVGFDVPSTIHTFTCIWCGQPGQDTNVNTKTHPGECREMAKKRRMRKSDAKRRAKLAKGKRKP